LYMMGGLAIAEDRFSLSNSGESSRSTQEQIIISAAGPIAGFLFAVLIILGVYLGGGSVGIVPSEGGIPLVWPYLPEGAQPLLTATVRALLYINIFWGILNLLPVYPLDGGQIARALFMAHDPWNGAVRSLWLSTITGGIFAVMALLLTSSIFIPILFGLLAISSYMTLMQYQGGGGFGGTGGGPGRSDAPDRQRAPRLTLRDRPSQRMLRCFARCANPRSTGRRSPGRISTT
jgi:stage IV sporulation protein FB